MKALHKDQSCLKQTTVRKNKKINIKEVRILILDILLSMQSFEFNEDTGAINSCAILFDNVLHIFGGKQHSSYEKQVSIFYSKNKRCGLRNIGSLSSSFIKGTCTLSYDQTVGRDVPFLCFSETDPRGCVR